MRRRRDMAIPNSGNPFWQIDFKSGQFRGLIRNVFEPARYEKWFDGGKIRRNVPDPRIDDYVLTFTN